MKRLASSFALALLIASTVHCESARPGLRLDQSLQGSWNPIGIQLGTKLYYRIPLVRAPGILWESTRIDLGVTNELSPAFDFAGAYVDIEPIAFFDLELAAKALGYYKALGHGFNELPGLDAGFDNTALDGLGVRDSSGYLLSATPTLKAALGPLVVLDSLHFSYFDVDSSSGFFFDIVNNVVLAKRAWEIKNEAFAMADVGGGFLVGLNDTWLLVPDSLYVVHHVNLVGVVSAPWGRGKSFYAAVLAGFYLQDRYLRHELRAAGQAGLVFEL